MEITETAYAEAQMEIERLRTALENMRRECEIDQPYEWRAGEKERAKKEASEARAAFHAALDALVKEKT